MSPRERLLAGVTTAVAEKGYAATTIADVVAEARVSKRTFYEHFEDKEACFLAAYDAATDRLLGILADAAAGPEPSADATVAAYLAAVAATPELTRMFLIDILAVGPRALAHRRRAMRRFSEQVVALVEELRARAGTPRPLSPTVALAVAGGVTELMLAMVESEQTREARALHGAAVELIEAVAHLTTHPPEVPI